MHKTYTITNSNGATKGRFFWQESAKPEKDKGICFVPESLIEDEELNRPLYLELGWARTNCGSQPQGEGSHMFPNVTNPVLEETPEQEARVKEFLKWK